MKIEETLDDTGTVTEIVAYPTDRDAYGRLCAMLTTGNRRAEKGDCKLGLADLLRHADGVLMIVLASTTPRRSTRRSGSPRGSPSP